MNQGALIQATRTELVWRGAPLGAMRGGQFCPERFSMDELQELANLIADELSPRRRQVLRVVEHVCGDLSVEVDSIYTPRRQTDRTVSARNLSVFYSHGFFPSMGDIELAQIFQRTRSCMTHARQWVIDRRETDKEFNALYHRLRSELQAKLFPEHKAA